MENFKTISIIAIVAFAVATSGIANSVAFAVPTQPYVAGYPTTTSVTGWNTLIGNFGTVSTTNSPSSATFTYN